jgi:hypothetical protein
MTRPLPELALLAWNLKPGTVSLRDEASLEPGRKRTVSFRGEISRK